MGLATVVDLRTPPSRASRPRGPPAPPHPPPAAPSYDQAQRIGRTQLRDGNAGDRYLWYLEGGSAALAEAMVLMTSGPLPARLPLLRRQDARRAGRARARLHRSSARHRRGLRADATRMELIIGGSGATRSGRPGGEIPLAFAVLATSMSASEGLDERHAGPQWALDRACRPTASTSSRCSWSNRDP